MKQHHILGIWSCIVTLIGYYEHSRVYKEWEELLEFDEANGQVLVAFVYCLLYK